MFLVFLGCVIVLAWLLLLLVGCLIHIVMYKLWSKFSGFRFRLKCLEVEFDAPEEGSRVDSEVRSLTCEKERILGKGKEYLAVGSFLFFPFVISY